MRVVWIEDSEVLRYTLAIYCEKNGARSEHITDIDEFCEKFVKKLTDDDLVLLDILFDKTGMRDTNGRGYKALHCMREAGKSHVPVVILTVLDEEEVKPKVAEFDNVRRIIRKPVTPDELEDALNEALEWKTTH